VSDLFTIDISFRFNPSYHDLNSFAACLGVTRFFILLQDLNQIEADYYLVTLLNNPQHSAIV
jgi:hypothetical protein